MAFAPVSYADAPARLAALRGLAAAALGAWAQDPRLVNAQATHLKYWTAAYALGCALAEQNPAWAVRLAGPLGEPAEPGQGIPTSPPAVRWVVDEDRPNSVSLTVDVAGTSGALSVNVTPPGVGHQPFRARVTLGLTRQSAVFDAPTDGIYQLVLTVANAPLLTLYVPVLRTYWAQLREAVRQLAYPYASTLPRPDAPLRLRVALLAAAEAACRTGQPSVALRLLAACRALPGAPTPTALFPTPRHD